jgi:hypothetical protein
MTPYRMLAPQNPGQAGFFFKQTNYDMLYMAWGLVYASLILPCSLYRAIPTLNWAKHNNYHKQR